MHPIKFVRIGCALAVFAASLAVSSQAALVVSGTYQLHNHPDGSVRPPLYGLRLDELYNVTSGNDVFTFDFDHAQSDMKLDYDFDAQSIHIHGQAWGGRDIGSAYANDQYLGVYAISFTYSVGVGQVPGDDDLWVTGDSGKNTGMITSPLGHSFALADKSDGNYTFRFGDEDHDNGHRGYAGISGWGWLTINGGHAPQGADDWLFTAVWIPEPSSLLLLIGASLGAAARWR